MTPLEFVAALAEALAWPVGLVVITLLFRRHLSALFPRLRTLAYRDVVRAEFAAELEKVEDETAFLPASTEEQTDAGEDTAALERLQEAVSPEDQPAERSWTTKPPERLPFEDPNAILLKHAINPGAAIEAAWSDLVQDIATALRRQSVYVTSEDTIHEYLVEGNVLPPETPAILEGLKKMRNIAVTNPQALEAEDAAGFDQVVQRLRRALRSPPLPPH